MVKIELVDDVMRHMKETDEYVEKVLAGEIPIDKEKAEYTIVCTPEDFSRMFTPERVRLLLKVRKNNIKNIYQLAKELGRKYEAVHRDLKYLESFRLIRIKTKDNKKIPCLNKIKIPLLLGN